MARVKTEAGVTAEVLSIAGHTTYEFYSATRQRPVCNDIAWYLMKAASGESAPNRLEGFVDGGYYTIPQAMERITYSQDRALVRSAWARYTGLKK